MCANSFAAVACWFHKRPAAPDCHNDRTTKKRFWAKSSIELVTALSVAGTLLGATLSIASGLGILPDSTQ